MSCRHLRLFGQLLVGVLLYGQFAVAAYACPLLSGAGPTDTTDAYVAVLAIPANTVPSAAAPMPLDCEGMSSTMDPSSAKLCSEHCAYGQQSDQVWTVALPGVLLNTLYVASAAPPFQASLHSVDDATLLLAGAGPPHAILHCCFRI